MKMKDMVSAVSVLLAVCFVASAGSVFAGPVPASERAVFAQGPDQDPNTPPDCKKYPKDVRCKK